jgi:hypothetical protein
MANTIVQFKRSTANNVPAALSVAEPAYSFLSGKLFLGNTDGSIIAVGGKYFVDQSNTIFDLVNTAYTQANSAYNAANTSSTVGSDAFAQANTARTHANSAFAAANAAFSNGNTTHTLTVAAFSAANASFANGNTNFVTTVAAFGAANAAFDTANTKFASSGGTISGTVTVTGDLIVTGNTVTTDTSSMNIGDPLIFLAANNRTTDAVDIGWVATYNTAAVTLRTGMFRDATTKEYYVFDSYTEDPAGSNHINPAANGFAVSVLNAAIRTSNLNLGGANAILWLQAIHGTANAAFSNANGTHTLTIASFGAANAAFANGNTTHTLTISAFAAANASFANGNTNFGTTVAAFDQANTARTHANSAFANANTTHTLTISAFAAANAAFANANGTHTLTIAAFGAANASFANGNTNFATTVAAFNVANGSSNAVNLTSGTIASARLSGSYTGITGVGTIISGLWQGGIVNVAYGGTGMSTFTTNGILYGNNSGALKVTAAGTDGQVLLANPAGVPVFSMLDGGTF